MIATYLTRSFLSEGCRVLIRLSATANSASYCSSLCTLLVICTTRAVHARIQDVGRISPWSNSAFIRLDLPAPVSPKWIM